VGVVVGGTNDRTWRYDARRGNPTTNALVDIYDSKFAPK
jgi:hypothetical protein